MSVQRGEDCIVGVGQEATRGTFAEAQAWVPARTPTGLKPVLERTPVKESRGSKVASVGSETTQIRAEGDLELNVRVETIGHFLRSFFGSVVSVAKAAPNAAVVDHTFDILENSPEHPSLSLSLSQEGGQDYRYKLGLVSALELELVPDDLVKAVASLIFSAEEENPGAAYSPSFDSDDVYFRHQDVTIKLADDVSGLAAASALLVKSLKLTLPNGGRPNQNVSELNPGNMYVGAFDMGGSFELDLQNTDLHDAFIDGEYKALQITLLRTDVTIGASANPALVFTFPRISFENWTPNRPIEDVVTEALEFMVHNDETAGYAARAVLTNLVPDYEADSES